MMYKVANIISDEARAKHHEALRNQNYDRYYGLTYWSPNINIFRDPRGGRGHETYGEDPYLTGQMGTQFLKGLQGNDSKYLKLVATAKQLKNFKRVALDKGEETTVVFVLNVESALRYYNAANKQYEVEPGDFEFQIGSSSEDIKSRKIIIVR